MRTAASLLALGVALGLAACSAPDDRPEALPDESVPAATSTPTPAFEDPAAEAEALYAEHGGTYLGEAIVEEVSLGVCEQIESDSVGVAFRDLVTVGGYSSDDAAMALLVAAYVYCPEHLPAVEKWAEPLPEFGE
ncbi:hypothetical protein ACFQBY_02535 [Promicromonospora citrea]|uniref:DUF732 domain-containing protein n=1 Tax=Promicromonospora citrea TaxID=43677 RepID=A0A8H9GGF6_9MICO|nr:hypothetical protein [Promicromonospora citrea]NNH52421.1 hypothetical protein [Promicromonospora citrea]GGM22191.1 hypothetical protein GCM10010102_17320 [Promicromonospora citrea]